MSMNETTNDFFRMVENHRSVRSYHTDREISPEHERMIVAAAQRSSSSCNLQTYAFISVKDREKRKKIAEICANQWHVYQANLFYLVCIDLYKMKIVTEKTGYRYYQEQFFDSFLMAAMDTAIAAQSAALAAESMGYGICMIGGVRNHPEKIIEIMGLPEKVFPVTGLCVGIPAKTNPIKPRLPLKGVYFDGAYDPKAVEEAIEEYDRVMLKSGIYKDREIPLDEVERIAGADAQDQYGWIEHSARRISSKNPERARAHLRSVLDKAGFGFS
jgi:FMN reductase (NADPH)